MSAQPVGLGLQGGLERILLSIKKAKEAKATLRVGPELEITGYGCLDHFLESDTFLHSWEMIARILKDPSCRDIILDIGVPVMHRNVRIVINGNVVAQGSQFSLNDVEVITATVDLEDVRSFRCSPSRDFRRSRHVHTNASRSNLAFRQRAAPSIRTLAHRKHEHRSSMRQKPRSRTDPHVGCNQQVLRDVRMVCAEDTYTPGSPQEFSNRIFHTRFMGSTNSSKETRSRDRDLSKAIGA